MAATDEINQPQTAVSDSLSLVSLVVPTRNESQNILPLLKRLALALAETTAIEVIFVDDSTDDTVQTIEQAAPQFPFPVRVIARLPERRNGLSGAVVEGFRAVQGEWMCVMDADLQHPPEVLPAMLARAQEAQADIVLGSRKADIFGPMGLSRSRAMTSQALTLLARIWFPRLLKNVSDPLTGLFLVRREAVDVSVLRPDGFKILLEILIRCPGLRVSEIHFDFAQRREGESKADFQEGMRFFRHLLRLRLTANRSFPRLFGVALVSVLLDTAVFMLLQQTTTLPYLVTAVFIAEVVILGRFWLTEKWVLGGGHPVPGWPSLRRFWLTNQLSLFLVRLPLLYLFMTLWDWPMALAILLAIVIEGVVRYALSEQWVFSRRGITMWQPGCFRYVIHDLLYVESQIELPELAYFATSDPVPHIDLQVRIDRHGTPSLQPGALTYSERMSRFGFGVAIMPGTTYTEVVVSPGLARVPYAFYKSVLEPVLRWEFARRGYALLYGAAVARGGEATLIVPDRDVGKTALLLTAVSNGNYQFMADDFVIVAAAGRIFSYPKLITVTPEVLRATAVATRFTLFDRLRLRWQNLFYGRWGRKLGLRLGRSRWPIATFNIYWQRLWPPPKQAITDLIPSVTYANQANLRRVVLMDDDRETAVEATPDQISQFICRRQQAVQGFAPYQQLVDQFTHLSGRDWRETEQAIIAQAVRDCQPVTDIE